MFYFTTGNRPRLFQIVSVLNFNFYVKFISSLQDPCKVFVEFCCVFQKLDHLASNTIFFLFHIHA